MNTVDVITRKRDGSALNAEEIRYMVGQGLRGWPDSGLPDVSHADGNLFSGNE